MQIAELPSIGWICCIIVSETCIVFTKIYDVRSQTHDIAINIYLQGQTTL